jgi:glucans biosynthesis protein
MMGAAGLLALVPQTAFGQRRGAPKGGTAFSWELLQQRAAALAKSPYRAPQPVAEAAGLDFDAMGTISYRPEKTLAGGVRLFPIGNVTAVPVTINLVEGGRARPVPFSKDLFQTGGKAMPLGFAGFRFMESGRESDWLAFLGASYFRAAGSQDQYGLSARGLAVNTGIADREEFPTFTEFWIEAKGRDSYTVYALLDGVSVTGAFRFDCRHPDGVEQDVSSVLHLRRDVERLGIAPATSMFWYDDRARRTATDWRPEIHDSDGLAMLTASGERIWRPVRNPAAATIDSFADANVRAFGLMQRDRNFDHYQDDGAFYDRRPNLWVQPKGDWGAGSVMLYAFPAVGETVDNIVSFWTPKAAAKAGQTLRFDYRLTWGSDDPSVGKGAHVVDCWVGAAGRPGLPPTPGARKLVVDFVGPALAGLTRQSGVTADIGVTNGKVLHIAAYPVVGQANRWRVTADVTTKDDAGADIRLYLKRGDGALSETLLVPVTPA